MAILRNSSREKYTVVNQNILNDVNLDLRDIALLIKLLSLPDGWEFSEKGLEKICPNNGRSSIRTGLKKLEKLGYLARKKIRNQKNQFVGYDWIIMETPKLESPRSDFPKSDFPKSENSLQYNTKELNTKELNTNSIKQSVSPSLDYSINNDTSLSNGQTDRLIDNENYNKYLKIIKQNIGYARLCVDYYNELQRIDEVLRVIVDVVVHNKQSVKIQGNIYSAEIVKSVFLNLNYDNIVYVINKLNSVSTEIKNMQNYLISVLYSSSLVTNNSLAVKTNDSASVKSENSKPIQQQHKEALTAKNAFTNYSSQRKYTDEEIEEIVRRKANN